MLQPLNSMQLPRTEMRPGLESGNVDMVNGTQNVNLAGAAKTGIALEDARGIEVDTDRVIRTDDFELEKFMNEKVMVQMMPPGSENDHKFAEVTVNGQYLCLMMGEQATIPRKHLEALAQAKSLRMDQVKVVNQDGSIGFQEKAVTRQMYPFSVMHDPNPKGVPWLMKLLKNNG